MRVLSTVGAVAASFRTDRPGGGRIERFVGERDWTASDTEIREQLVANRAEDGEASHVDGLAGRPPIFIGST